MPQLPCDPGSTYGPLQETFRKALLELDQEGALQVLVQALEGGRSLFELVDGCVTPVLESIGEDWDHGRASLSEVYVAGRVAEQTVQALLGAQGAARPRTTVVAIALLEDYHTLGKRMVQLAVQAAGYTCVDYGRVTVDELTERILAKPPDLVLVSTLMLRSALRVREVKARLLQAGCTVPLCVGGAPFRFDPELWREVGADGFGRDSADALHLVARFCGDGHTGDGRE